MKRLPNGNLFLCRDLPPGTTEQDFTKALNACGLPVIEKFVSLRRFADGKVNAMICLSTEFVVGLVNEHIKRHGKDVRLVGLNSKPRPVQEQHHENLPPLQPMHMA